MGTSLINQLGTEELLIAVFAGILVLALERIWSAIGDRSQDNKKKQHAKKFLFGWLEETRDHIVDTGKLYGDVLKEWQNYLFELESSPGQDIKSPKLPYSRIHMPDISNLVIDVSPFMPEQAYIHLLHLNTKLQLIDERGRRFSDFIDNVFVEEPYYEARLRLAETVTEGLEFVLGVIEAAKINSSEPELLKWVGIGRLPKQEKPTLSDW